MKTFAITTSALALLSGIIAQGTFGHAIVVISLAIFVGVPFALFLILWFLFSLKCSGGVSSGWKKTAVIATVIGGGLLLSFGTGSLVHQWEIRKVREFVDATVLSLDDFYSRNGSYPSHLTELGITSTPALLQESGGYSSTGSAFSFEYWDKSGMMNGYVLQSTDREWRYFD